MGCFLTKGYIKRIIVQHELLEFEWEMLDHYEIIWLENIINIMSRFVKFAIPGKNGFKVVPKKLFYKHLEFIKGPNEKYMLIHWIQEYQKYIMEHNLVNSFVYNNMIIFVDS